MKYHCPMDTTVPLFEMLAAGKSHPYIVYFCADGKTYNAGDHLKFRCNNPRTQYFEERPMKFVGVTLSEYVPKHPRVGSTNLIQPVAIDFETLPLLITDPRTILEELQRETGAWYRVLFELEDTTDLLGNTVSAGVLSVMPTAVVFPEPLPSFSKYKQRLLETQTITVRTA